MELDTKNVARDGKENSKELEEPWLILHLLTPFHRRRFSL